MPVPVPQQRVAPAAEATHVAHLTLLVIEDDPAGTLTVPELPAAAGTRVRIRTARNLTEAGRLLTDDVDCILLDLALPPGSETRADGGAEGPVELATLKHVLRIAPRHAVLALTAEDDTELAAEAVRVGAQDYLFRGELDGRLLTRAIRYAVERKRADVAQHQLTESKLRAQENARLERGLLPTPLLQGSDLRFAARYRPGRSRALLGGDFYDTVRTPDGTVHAMIGDVCGHGPDEAALGVELRIAWRALTLAGLCGDELLSTLQQVLEHERESEEIFATLCTVDITPDGRRAGLCLAGHPAPLITRHGRAAQLLPYEDGGPALGLLPHARWPRRQVELGGSWSLMMYTDGLIEGRVGPTGTQRLGQEGMVAMINRQLAEGLSGEALLEAAVAEVRELNGGELTDDVAVLLLDRDRSTDRSRNGGRGRSASLPRPRPGSASPVSVQRPPL
ncbi:MULTISPECIES: PP2C family protein-serine/threonine phosphatase [Streptomyces]|uniref:PP2C family protein-serine/threonine phosphatase n=1 Tax=unclassified Streptomyces TaxID=2593676 RepID=UPI00088E2EE6|nr:MULTISPECIES: fused response regulator/phosphatase [unclassified Streptomyces]MDX2731574.1 fused response regulator/phosphatase [Streptomyces sp. PA03-2a]MDX3766989.1 fused response regulator/phosphatase [Streptomyces sp. AK08-01B]MDX3820370.1 fused response regulator/phosphatase [Streptomyces sp. AK08-01A]SCY70385.1 Serine phosphatase RsbU, regulator of sigma subunit [Streptomyces sp. 136MFCol5.1]SFT31114.1 Serine phosphatase RsbU, regulator of sigma subunit [Streptomyces sp. ok210]